MKEKTLEIDWIYHNEYFEVALTNYEEVKKLKEEIEDMTKKIRNKEKKLDDNHINSIADKNYLISNYAMVVVIFSALSLEAYINNYAINRLSKNYFTKYLDKLNPLAKWIIIPRITTGRQLDTGFKVIQDLSWLFSLRNDLVHYKSKKIQIKKGQLVEDPDFIEEYHAKRAINTVKNLMLEFKKIDRNADIIES